MSFSFYLEDLLCGPEPGKDNIAIIPMKALPNHLFGLDVSRSTWPEICRKAEVLFSLPLSLTHSLTHLQEFKNTPFEPYIHVYVYQISLNIIILFILSISF